MVCLGLSEPIDPPKCTFMVIRDQMAVFLDRALSSKRRCSCFHRNDALPNFRSNSKLSRGFTLLELIVVLIIISLMSALVVPKLAGPMSNLDLKTAAKKISASLRYVRSHAASEKTTYVALFDFDKNRLVIINSTIPPLARGDFGCLCG
ncbi:MAG: hypothetical protein CO012_01370 [Syntrophobacterales bacterium CG_4_8_14_3_um_filter_49_14]|nr:MAG: hypothetical protein CO012_01370 [Syntrophobacterales bacterium CG_4_8_14_3_um_filter_49_14]